MLVLHRSALHVGITSVLHIGITQECTTCWYYTWVRYTLVLHMNALHIGITHECSTRSNRSPWYHWTSMEELTFSVLSVLRLWQRCCWICWVFWDVTLCSFSHFRELYCLHLQGQAAPQRVAAVDKWGASYRSVWCGWNANRQHSDMLWVGPRCAGWDMQTMKLHGSVRRWVLSYCWCANWACVLLVGMQRSTERAGNSLVRGDEWIILNRR